MNGVNFTSEKTTRTITFRFSAVRTVRAAVLDGRLNSIATQFEGTTRFPTRGTGKREKRKDRATDPNRETENYAQSIERAQCEELRSDRF